MAEAKLNHSLLSETDTNAAIESEILLQEIHSLNLALSGEDVMDTELDSIIQDFVSVENESVNLKREGEEKLHAMTKNFKDESEKLYKTISALSEEIEELKLSQVKSHTDSYEEDFKLATDGISSLMAEKADLNNRLLEMRSTLENFNKQKQIAPENCGEMEKQLEELKELLKLTNENVASISEEREELMEEKALITSELSVLKAVQPVKDLTRGNSLFAEVDDNHQSLANKFVLVKRKIMMLEDEEKKLKEELNSFILINSIEKNPMKVHKDVLTNYAQLHQEMISHIHSFEERVESPQVVTVEDELIRLGWIHVMINNARQESAKIGADLLQSSINGVDDAVRLYEIQQEVDAMKMTEMRNKDAIKKLRQELEEYKKKEQELEEINAKTTGQNRESQTKVVRFEDNVKTDDSDTRKKGLKRLPKPQLYPKLVIDVESIRLN